MRNKIKEFLKTQLDPRTGQKGISAYRFWKDTNLSRPTAYRLAADPTYIPTGEVLDKICSAYIIQPGELLVWLPDGDTEIDSEIKKAESPQSLKGQKTKKDKSSRKRSGSHSIITTTPELAESA